jgi:formylglycine-generating enzyme required for sulfatase activity
VAAAFAFSLAFLASWALPQGAPKAEAPKLPGFVHVPAGQVWPGCTEKEYKERHLGNSDLKKELQYDIWGQLPDFPLPAFYIGKYEVTNAQWKQYLDAEFRTEYTTAKGDTLQKLAGQFVKFRGEPVESEWMAIYGLNYGAIVAGWKEMNVWQAGWPVESPPNDVSTLELPAGLKLTLYKTRVPQNWYGWCRLSGLGVGREYCDPTKPAAEAFKVPAEEPFKSLALADTDFAAYPVRSASPNEILAFAEWCGCELPTEYEWERAARGDHLRWPYPFGPWDHDKQKTLIAGAENERCRMSGTMRVDDESLAGSDSPFGARNMSGNVWELTRTFYDVHPRVVPAPPPRTDLANYALVAKGGSFGDRWQMLMVCARTGIIGQKGELSLRDNNRADSLGLRLARHADHPGEDLMLHSILHLIYDSASGDWNLYPHSFGMERMAGIDDVKPEDVGAPYIYFTKRAHGIAFAPLWATTLTAADTRAKPERNRYSILGALRSDVPLKMGVRLTNAEAKKLIEDREIYKKKLEEWKKLSKEKQKNVQLPDPPPEPDAYEKATEKNQAIWGLFREQTVAPGEWYVVYWNGFLGLVNRTRTMPPDAILIMDPKQISRKSAQPAAAQLSLSRDAIALHFSVWEQPTDKSKQITPPDEEHSDEWAICEAMPGYFIKGGPSARPYCWDVDVAFPVANVDDPVWKELVPDATTDRASTRKEAESGKDGAQKVSPGK